MSQNLPQICTASAQVNRKFILKQILGHSVPVYLPQSRYIICFVVDTHTFLIFYHEFCKRDPLSCFAPLGFRLGFFQAGPRLFCTKKLYEQSLTNINVFRVHEGGSGVLSLCKHTYRVPTVVHLYYLYVCALCCIIFKYFPYQFIPHIHTVPTGVHLYNLNMYVHCA